MTKPLSELITELLEMEAKATAPPWENSAGDAELETGYDVSTPYGAMRASIPVTYPRGVNNCKLIAHSRNHLKTILEALREAEETLIHIRQIVHQAYHEHDTIADCNGGACHAATNWLKKYSGEK